MAMQRVVLVGKDGERREVDLTEPVGEWVEVPVYPEMGVTRYRRHVWARLGSVGGYDTWTEWWEV